MAKLGAYYGLCPLIDHRSLLGISQDEENGIVIVTLGKNIAIKFKLSDQKQLYSWRTKEKFSSSIIYDKEESHYIAVFNESFVRSWSGNEEFLDKLKKLKFNEQIFSIFLCSGKSFIVFKNGAIYPLKDAVENRKTLMPVKIIDTDSEYITEVLHCNFNGQTYVGIVASSNENYKLYWTKFNENYQQDKYCMISLQRKDVDLNGNLFYSDQSSVNFLSLWSDGRIYSTELKDSDVNSSNIGELFAVIESISCKNYVSMIALDHNYIALYGCNSNEEGALLVIYNVQFKVVQSRQSFKLFTNGAKLWCIDGNLFLPVGQNLAVVPFHLDTEQLAALVGSHKVEIEPDPDISIVQKVQFANWGNNSKSNDHQPPKKIKPKIEDFLSQGYSENITFETLLSDLLKHKNVDVLSQAIIYFNDFPESCLVKVLKLILSLDSFSFMKQDMCDIESFPKNLQPLERAELIDLVLTKPFNETLLLPQLRSNFTLDEILIIFQYITFLLSEDGHALPSLNFIESEAKLIDWGCALLDSNYQKFLLSTDDRIKEVFVSLKNVIKELNYSDDMKQVAALLREIKGKKNIRKNLQKVQMDYSIEEFPLY